MTAASMLIMSKEKLEPNVLAWLMVNLGLKVSEEELTPFSELLNACYYEIMSRRNTSFSCLRFVRASGLDRIMKKRHIKFPKIKKLENMLFVRHSSAAKDLNDLLKKITKNEQTN